MKKLVILVVLFIGLLLAGCCESNSIEVKVDKPKLLHINGIPAENRTIGELLEASSERGKYSDIPVIGLEFNVIDETRPALIEFHRPYVYLLSIKNLKTIPIRYKYTNITRSSNFEVFIGDDKVWIGKLKHRGGLDTQQMFDYLVQKHGNNSINSTNYGTSDDDTTPGYTTESDY